MPLPTGAGRSGGLRFLGERGSVRRSRPSPGSFRMASAVCPPGSAPGTLPERRACQALFVKKCGIGSLNEKEGRLSAGSVGGEFSTFPQDFSTAGCRGADSGPVTRKLPPHSPQIRSGRLPLARAPLRKTPAGGCGKPRAARAGRLGRERTAWIICTNRRSARVVRQPEQWQEDAAWTGNGITARACWCCPAGCSRPRRAESSCVCCCGWPRMPDWRQSRRSWPGWPAAGARSWRAFWPSGRAAGCCRAWRPPPPRRQRRSLPKPWPESRLPARRSRVRGL